MRNESYSTIVDPLVSVCSITYNHEKYISECIEGLLKQHINFPIEIIIHDDASTDRTAQIVKEYATRYPNLIIPIFQKDNQYSKGKKPLINFVFPRTRGKYIALCEGDDYWTDPLKLQKQVDFLEANPDYVMCYHNAKIIDENGTVVKESKLSDNLKKDFSSDELIQGKMILTLTMCFRNILRKFPDELSKVHNGDKFLTSLLGNFGKGKYIADISDAIYRKHSGSIWSKLDEITQVYNNGVTRAWLHRYYKSIEQDRYADYFRKELVDHFYVVLQKISSSWQNKYENIILDIFTNYTDIIYGETEKQLRELLNFIRHPFVTGKDENKTTIQKTTNIAELQKKSNIIYSAQSNYIGNTLTINWMLTRKCNYTCTYCTVKDNKSGFFHNLADLESAVDKLFLIKKEYIKFIITGGEPTIYPYYIDFLKYIFNKFGTRATVATITNLSMPLSFFEKFRKSLCQHMDKISFIASFHFEHTDKEEFIKKVNYLSRNGIFIKTQILANPEYIDITKRLFEELSQTKNKKSKIDVKIIRENFGPNPDKRYSAQDLDWLKSFYKEFENEEVDLALLTNSQKIENLKFSANELITHDWNRFKGFECHAGIDSISINANGEIDPAVCFRDADYKKSNIFIDENPIVNFEKPILCPFEKCGCLADLLLTKKHPDYEHFYKSCALIDNSSFEYYLREKEWEYKKGLYLYCFESSSFLKTIDKPAISIIVISWRLHPDNLKNFQILEKQRDQNYELIFVDNGGKEGEFEILKPYIDTYVRLNTNTGAYLARNIGAVFAKAPILLFLEDDCIPSDQILSAHLEQYRSYEIVCARGVYKPKTDNPLNKIAGHYYLGPKPFPIYPDTEGNFSIKAELFFKVGGWDDAIRFGGGGVDLSRRIFDIEPELRKQIYTPAPEIYHDYATDNQHLAEKVNKQSNSRRYLRTKHPDYDNYLNMWQPFWKRSDALVRRGMTEAEPVSILIPTYNRASYIKEAILSAINQTCPPFEIVIVDDGSTDNTEAIIKTINSDKIRYIRKEHSGAPETRNCAIKESRSEFILWLDSDDVLLPNTLELYQSAIKKVPNADVYYGNLFVTDENMVAKRELKGEDWYNRNDFLIATLFCGDCVPNPGTLVRKSCYKRFGMYDNTFIRAHDYEFWCRISRSARFKHIGSFVCKWRWHASNMSSGSVTIDHSYEARIVRGMLQRFTIRELFPQLRWNDEKQGLSMAFILIGNIFFKYKDYDAALEFYDKSLAIIPADVCYVNIGIVYNQLRQFFRAYEAFLNALRLNPGNKQAKKLLQHISSFTSLKSREKGVKTSDKRQEQGCETLQQQESEINIQNRNVKLPGNAQWDENQYTRYGEELFAKGDHAAALEAFSLAVDINPKYAQAYNNLGVTYLKIGDSRSALENIRKAAALDPDDPDAVVNLGELLISLDKVHEAKDVLETYLSGHPECSGAQDLLFKIKTSETIHDNIKPSLTGPLTDERASERSSSVLLVVHNFLPHNITGGVENYTFNLAKELKKLGVNVSVFYPLVSPEKPLYTITEGSYRGITTFTLSTDKYNIFSSISHEKEENAFRSFLCTHGFDIVHVHHTLGLPLSLILAAKQAGMPVILTLHDFWFMCLRVHMYQYDTYTLCSGPESLEKCRSCFLGEKAGLINQTDKDAFVDVLNIRQKFVRNLFDIADLITAPSNFVAEFHEKYGLGEKRIKVSPLGIIPIEAHKRRQSKIITFGYIGTINEMKGIFGLVEAFKATHGEARLIICGGGPPDLVERLETSLNDPRIAYRGAYSSDQLSDILKHMDMIIVPSLIESYCLTVREALASGVPVIASRTGGIPEIVTHGENGILFSPWDYQELQSAIQGMIDDPECVNKLQHRGSIRTVIDDALEWERQYLQYVKRSDRIRSLNVSRQTDLMMSSRSDITNKPDLAQDKDGCSTLTDSVKTRSCLPAGSSQDHLLREPRSGVHNLVSIIILTFNQLNYTKECIKSLEKCTPEPHEIIFVDNGSSDGTREYLEKYSWNHKHVELILNEENKGFARGNNQGVAKAKGRYILLLNNDVVVTGHWLERLIAHSETSSEIGIVGPMSNSVSGPQQVATVPYGKDMKAMQRFARDFTAKNKGKTSEVLRVVGFCLLIKRNVLDIIGGLDENYGNGNYEDDDLCLRARIAGFRNFIAHDVFIYHYGSMTFKGNAIDYLATMEDNRKYFADKWRDFVDVSDDSYRVNMTREEQLKKLIEWGEEQFSQGNVSAATKIFNRVLELDRTNSQALNNLGVIQWQTGDAVSAISTFQTALTFNPGDSDALSNLVETAEETGRFDLINTGIFDVIKQAQPENPEPAILINAP